MRKYIQTRRSFFRRKRGHQQAFDMLVQRYSEPLYFYSYRLMRNAIEAEDIVQHVFMQLYLCLPTMNTRHPLRAWLFRVTHNRCIDMLRARKRHALCFSDVDLGRAFPNLEDDEACGLERIIDDRLPLPEEQVEAREMRRNLLRLIDELSPKMRNVLTLHLLAQLTFAEIAQILQIPSGTVKTYYHRARSRLAHQWREQMQE